MIYLHTKFHMSSSNDSLVIAPKPKPKHKFHAVSVLFLTLCKKVTNYKTYTFFQDLLPYTTSGPCINLQ
jgi:hypothetical protein